ncbi:MAG: excinuclease ABC subunit UvrA [Lactobacillales bacterium]|jgi:excinuclease ABC subunit A|nr:excinuclease ABC subunit UvrA [Lactobacillales bacterium]
MKNDKIVVRGARENNLKNIDIEIPRNKLVVITGLSGSGKSSLAFNTLYAEGQRRYVESLSAYARQFLGNMDKPDVDSIDGLSPAVSIEQKSTNNNPRSTVGTVTEINDYLRLMFARVGVPMCPNDHIPITSQSIEQIVDEIEKLSGGAKLQIIAPIIRGKKGGHVKVFEQIAKEGYVRVRVNGEVFDISEVPELDKNNTHNIDVIVDRIVLKEGVRSRLFESVEAATRLGHGYVKVDVNAGAEELFFSEHYACTHCGFTIPEVEPRLFSFNAPYGACETCHGLGEKLEIDPDLLIPDDTKTLNEGAIAAWNPISSKYYPTLLGCAAEAYGIDMDTPWKKLPKKHRDIVLNGSSKKFHFYYVGDFGNVSDKEMAFEGVLANIHRRYKDSSSEFVRETMRKYMRELPCPTCHGYRLNEQALSVKIEGRHIAQVSELSVSEAHEFFKNLELKGNEADISRPIVKEICSRLEFLENVGLNYLSLSRKAGTLSGGEAQRIRLATQIGSQLSGIMYVLDEPSIGLHQRDNNKLIESLRKMRDLGNTLIVVEHDEDTMRAADFLIDIGPGAGLHGGEVVASGTPKQVEKNPKSLTGRYLSGKEAIPVPTERRKGSGKSIKITGAEANNLKNIDVEFPLGKLIAVTGVSGSGKSSLVNYVLKRSLAQKLNRNSEKPGKYKKITGYEGLEKIIAIDQSPIGRTPRSNPATYTGVFDDIRGLFAQTNEAKIRGYQKGRFSFNVKGGRCERCSGDGIIKIAMHFLPDVYVPCEVCHGKRYNSETLEVHYKSKNIAEVLDMTVTDALEFFENVPKIRNKIQTIHDVGLGYVKLGQSSTTLSGGEAQRMKLASELHKKEHGQNFYILDEPTTGLHVDDIKRLSEILNRLVDHGNTVLVIEHNLDVIKVADHIIDIGPEGGDGGGTVVATGTPEAIAQVPESYTGQYLKPHLNGCILSNGVCSKTQKTY